MNARRRYLVTTLALLAVVALYVAIEASSDRPAPRLPRTVAPVTRAARTPAAREILARGAELALTDGQRAQLEALDGAWRAEGAALEAATDEAGEEFSAFARRQGARGASLAEVQRQSARYRELSAELRANRMRHAAAAMAILNDVQRRRLAPVAAPQTSGGRECSSRSMLHSCTRWTPRRGSRSVRTDRHGVGRRAGWRCASSPQLAGVAEWAVWANVRSDRPAMDMNGRVSSGAAAFPVALAVAERGPIEGAIVYSGSVAPFTEEDVYPRVAGRIVDMPVYPGDADIHHRHGH